MTSFETDIKPLFEAGEIACMSGQGVLLADYNYMSDMKGDDRYQDYANARHVLGRLSGSETPRMPPGGPLWSTANLNLLKQWIGEGANP